MTQRIGLMGCGIVAGYGHLPAIRDTPGLSLEAVFDPDASAAQAAAGRYHVPHAVTDLEAFFDLGLDVVAVTSPAPTHLTNVLAAAERGLPILCEKPLAMDEAEGLQMIEVTRAAGVPLYCGFCYRFSPAALKIKQIVRDGDIGEVRSLRLIYNWDCHGKYVQDEAGAWVLNPHREGRMLEGGPMFDCGTHQIDLARWWLGSEVVQIAGHGAWVDSHEAPDHAWLHMDHDSGAHTMVEMSYSYGHTTRDKFSVFLYELIGDRGLIQYHRNESRFELRTNEKTQSLTYHEEKNFEGMYAALVEALKTGQPGDLCTGEDAVRVAQLAREGTDLAMARRPAAPVTPDAR